MATKIPQFFPSYQIESEFLALNGDYLTFLHDGARFSTKKVAASRFLRITAAHEATLNWAHANKLLPPMWISHAAPTKPDGRCRKQDRNDPHRHYEPYSMVVVTFHCFGETEPRRIKIYFCNIVTREINGERYRDLKEKGTYIVALDPRK